MEYEVCNVQTDRNRHYSSMNYIYYTHTLPVIEEGYSHNMQRSKFYHMIVCVCLLLVTSTDEDIAKFAQHYKLQKTLRYLAEDNSVGDLPVYLPKVLQHNTCISGSTSIYAMVTLGLLYRGYHLKF